jgi:hypothetical protein
MMARINHTPTKSNRRRMALLVIGLIGFPHAGHAEATCDFEHHCYEDQPQTPQQRYHLDPAHPDLETPPPAPEYPQAGGQGRSITVQPNAGEGCRLFRMRSVPNIEPLIVEICSIPPDEERAIRERAGSAAE